VPLAASRLVFVSFSAWLVALLLRERLPRSEPRAP
jgi:hypothetical protein